MALAAAAFVALSACQDATGVGLGLLDDDAASPNLRTLAATAIDTVASPTAVALTAGFASRTSAQPQTRVLVGRVVDPVFGDAEATGYVDAIRGALPEDFTDQPITTVTLELRRDYTYGDTTASLPVEVRFVEGNWGPAGLPADTVLGTGDVVGRGVVAASDTLARLVIPASAMAGRDTVFTAADFETRFEGFALSVPAAEAPLPGAVAGFDLLRSRIVVATSADTLSLAFNEVYSLVRQSAPTLPPAGVLPIRSGSTFGAARLSFNVAAVGAVPLAQAQLALPLDGTLSRPGGPFKRPLAREAALYGVRRDADPVRVALVRTSTRGDLRTVASAEFTGLVQQILLGTGAFEPRFEVRVATSPASLNVLPVAPVSAPGTSPRLLLTVVTPTP